MQIVIMLIVTAEQAIFQVFFSGIQQTILTYCLTDASTKIGQSQIKYLKSLAIFKKLEKLSFSNKLFRIAKHIKATILKRSITCKQPIITVKMFYKSIYQ